MRNFFTLLFVMILLGGNFQTYAQNLIENWDGNGATGAGSDAGTFGWTGTPAVTWGIANAAGTIRYIDNLTYTYNGVAWPVRGLSVRWDGTGGTNLTTVFAYPVTLEATKSYLFSGKFGWHSNGSGTFKYVIGINTASDNSGTILHSDTVTITDANRMKFYGDTLTFSPSTAGTFYLTVAMPQPGASNNAIMGMVADLSIVKFSPCIKNLDDQNTSLTLSNISNVTSNINLPAGTGGVTINWTSSNPAVISNSGVVTRPAKYNTLVTLTANLSATCDGYVNTRTKAFNAIVISSTPTPELLAKWDFAASKISSSNGEVKVADVSGSNFIGTLKDVAGIRTIGRSVKYNVLDLGYNKGYFDMDTAIGAAVYSLQDYTMSAYFRVDSSYTELNSNGNFLWNFSNSANNPTDQNGYIIGSLKNQSVNITTNTYTSDQHVTLNANAPMGSWHHFAYTQKADSGKIYVDGILKVKGLVSSLAINTLPKAGRIGTRFNWLGRSCYPTDVFLRNTLVYDFELYSVPVTADDWVNSFDVPNTIIALNAAYTERSNDTLAELKAELKHLSLGDVSAVSSSLTLTLNGILDPSISISWVSSDTTTMKNNGTLLKQKEYLNTSVVLLAILSKGGQKVTKSFNVTIMAKPGTSFASDLLLNYNFAGNLVSGAVVTDAAEKHFTGDLKKNATVLTMGPADNRQNVLNLTADSAYFNMGNECGKLMYGLTDYSVSVYFLVSNYNTKLSNNGNFIYAFSNNDSAATTKTGYMFGRATKASHCVSSSYYSSGNMETTLAPNETSKGIFHHFVFTQKGLVGTTYLDGKVVATMPSFTNTPLVALAKAGRTGTLCNWLGRSNYIGDAYLSKALLSNFQLYRKALEVSDIDTMQVKAANLNLAYIHDSIPELLSEKNNIDLGDLSALISDISLPANGAFDPSVVITWTSSFPGAITTGGVVTRPDFLNAKVILTATLTKNGQSVTREFPATVLAKTGSEFASDLLLNYNFASNLVSGTTVTDAAEKHLTGTLMKGASVSTIGSGNSAYNVLNLASDSAYFDMGIDCGKLIYGLSDYSISVYFAIDKSKTNFSNKGNIIYTFSNSDSSSVKKNGYIFGRATNATHCVSPNAESGNMLTAAAKSEVSKGTFHHLVFTQKGNTGTTYLDGDTVSSVVSFTNIPYMALPKDGFMGTTYNWLGRSSYQGDAYLANAMIADFKLYKKVLTSADVKTMQDEKASLDAAYKGTSAVAKVEADKLNINTSIPGLIQIIGLSGKEKVSVFDILGLSIAVKDTHLISVRSGIYIVKVDSRVAKVYVK